jgi:hypothetical protein
VNQPVKKTEANFAEDVRDILESLIAVMDEAAAEGLTINFSINTDAAAKKASVTALTVTRSFL